MVSNRNFRAAWCCDRSRLFIIFSLLCGPEATVSPSPSSKRTIKLRSPKAESSSSGLGPFTAKSRSRSSQSQLSKGIGYGDSFLRREKKAGPSVQDTDHNTRELQLYLEALSLVLPSGKRVTTTFDRLPQPTVTEMLRRSPILEQASELLRYASIEEMTKQFDSIKAVLDCMETMFSHNSTRLLLVQERILVPPGERLPHVVLGRSSRGRVTKPASYETAQSISIIMENLGVPCHKFIEASRRIATIAGEEEGKKVLEMAQRICALSDDLSVARSRLAVQESEPAERPGSLSLTTPSTNVHTRRARADADKVARDVAHQECLARVAEFHRANCVKEVSDDLIISSSCYEKEAREAEKSEHAPGRMRKLLAQVSSLSTDLPEGIYVRHGESRLDVLKVLIIGPADTPYEHGLFEFDLFCGSDFPQRPPKMFFRTTGGGRVRFNPNLYNTGKSMLFFFFSNLVVRAGLPAPHWIHLLISEPTNIWSLVCFSLLGTWDGQPWEPDCSSLLQLLVSIQGMISHISCPRKRRRSINNRC